MTPDVNVLVASSRQDHPHHQPALAWLEAALQRSELSQSQTLAILPMVAVGFLRLVTHPKVFKEPTPTSLALGFMDTLLNAPGVYMPGLQFEWDLLTKLCEKYTLVGNHIPYAWIASALNHHHLHLVTFDKGFRRLVKPSRLTVLST